MRQLAGLASAFALLRRAGSDFVAEYLCSHSSVVTRQVSANRPLLAELRAKFWLAVPRTQFSLAAVGVRLIFSLLARCCLTAWGSFTRRLELPTVPSAESVPSSARFNDFSVGLGRSRNPVGVGCPNLGMTQGSSPLADIPLATLGYSTESRWDSKLGHGDVRNYHRKRSDF